MELLGSEVQASKGGVAPGKEDGDRQWQGACASEALTQRCSNETSSDRKNLRDLLELTGKAIGVSGSVQKRKCKMAGVERLPSLRQKGQTIPRCQTGRDPLGSERYYRRLRASCREGDAGRGAHHVLHALCATRQRPVASSKLDRLSGVAERGMEASLPIPPVSFSSGERKEGRSNRLGAALISWTSRSPVWESDLDRGDGFGRGLCRRLLLRSLGAADNKNRGTRAADERGKGQSRCLHRPEESRLSLAD